MKAFGRLLVADVRQFVRERTALFWTFAFPIFFILIFGAIFSGENGTSLSIGLVAEDNSPAAQALVSGLQQVPAFETRVGEREAELAALKTGDRQAVIVITPDFGKSVSQGSKGQVDVYYDPAQMTTLQVALPIIRQVLDQFDRSLSQTPSLVQVNEKTLQARRLRAIDYLVPGILGMALMQLGIFAAEPLVGDRQNKVLKRLGATPLRRSTMVTSAVVFRLLIAVAQAALILVVARLVFGVPMMGNWLALVGVVVLGTLTFVAMGYMLSAFARTQETIMPLLMAVQFPMMFLSGIFFSVDMMPGFMKPLMSAMPLTYLADSLRQIMVSSFAMHSQLINVGVLGAWFIVCIIVAVRFFRWE